MSLPELVPETGWLFLIWLVLQFSLAVALSSLRDTSTGRPPGLLESISPLKGRWLHIAGIAATMLLLAVPLGVISGAVVLSFFTYVTYYALDRETFTTGHMGFVLNATVQFGAILGVFAVPAVCFSCLRLRRAAGVVALLTAPGFAWYFLYPRDYAASELFGETFRLPGVGAPFFWALLLTGWGIWLLLPRRAVREAPIPPDQPL